MTGTPKAFFVPRDFPKVSLTETTLPDIDVELVLGHITLRFYCFPIITWMF